MKLYVVIIILLYVSYVVVNIFVNNVEFNRNL